MIQYAYWNKIVLVLLEDNGEESKTAGPLPTIDRNPTTLQYTLPLLPY